MKIIEQSVEFLDNLPYMYMIKNVVSASNQCWKTGMMFEGNMEEGERIIRSRIKVGHESLIEHAYMTMKFTTNRAISHEIVRHRLASYTQASTRYQNYTKEEWGGLTFIKPLWITEAICGDWDAIKVGGICDSTEYSEATKIWLHGRKQEEWEYDTLLKNYGKTPDEVRGCLPNDLATTLVMTTNMREWRHFFKLRAFSTTGRAHPQIVQLATMAFDIAHNEYPCFFDDLLELRK